MTYKTIDMKKAQEITGYKKFNKEQFFVPVNEITDHPGVMLLQSFVNGLHFF